MLVSEIMNSSVVSCTPDESAAHAARLMAGYNIGSLPVCSGDGRLRGMITDRDIILRCVAEGTSPANTPLREIMTRSVVFLSPSDSVSDAVCKMRARAVRRMPVLLDGKVVGIVSLCDFIRRREGEAEAAAAFCDISSNVKRAGRISSR